ncbi:adhesin, partial [Salmonella enterica subsp. enterica]|nr:adhesin [Salmonella enterica subsp. enterica serovar Newport]
DTQFRHINIAEADHFKQFLRQIERVNSKVFF